MLRFAHVKDKVLIEHETNPGVAFVLSFEEQVQLVEYLEEKLKQKRREEPKPKPEGVVGFHKTCNGLVKYEKLSGNYVCLNCKLILKHVTEIGHDAGIEFYPDYCRIVGELQRIGSRF